MSITAIILLILLGILLFAIEFLVIPGVTIAGIGGTISLGTAIVFAYKTYGSTAGNMALLGTILFMLVSFYMFFRSKTWKKLMLEKNIDGKVNIAVEHEEISVGDKGKTITRLNPIGKVMVNNKILEGKSTGQFINENTEIEVIKILNNNIVVKPLNL